MNQHIPHQCCSRHNSDLYRFLTSQNHDFTDRQLSLHRRIGYSDSAAKRRELSVTGNDVVVTDRQSPGSTYSISSWLDEQLRNPLAASMRTTAKG